MPEAITNGFGFKIGDIKSIYLMFYFYPFLPSTFLGEVEG